MESAEADLKSSQVTVKGVVEPQSLADYVYKKTGKHAAVVKVEPEKKEEEKPKEEKSSDGGGEKAEAKEDGKEKKEGGGGDPPAKAAEEVVEEDLKMELRKNEMYNYYFPQQNYQHQFYQQRYVQEMNAPTQIFSDENPNACAVM